MRAGVAVEERKSAACHVLILVTMLRASPLGYWMRMPAILTRTKTSCVRTCVKGKAEQLEVWKGILHGFIDCGDVCVSALYRWPLVASFNECSLRKQYITVLVRAHAHQTIDLIY